MGSGCGEKRNARWVQNCHYGRFSGLPAGEVDRRVEIALDNQTAESTRIGPSRQVEVVTDLATTRTRFGTGKEPVGYSNLDPVPAGCVMELAGKLSHGGVGDRPRQVSDPHHSRYVQVLDHEDLAMLNKGLGGLVDEVSAGVGDLTMSLGESGPRSLAAIGPRCGSGHGLVGRFE